MITMEKGKGLALNYLIENEERHWLEWFDKKGDMIIDLRSENPHVYVCAMKAAGHTAKDITEVWEKANE